MSGSNRTLLLLTFLLTAAACSGTDSEGEAAMAQEAQDTTVKQIEREPLTEEDLAGMDMADLAVELPWTSNRIRRAAGPAAPRSLLEEVELSVHDGFQRILFTFSGVTPFPGYNIQVAEPGATVPCGDEEEMALEGEGTRVLVIRLAPARAHEGDEVMVPTGTSALDGSFTEGGLICDDGDQLFWTAGMELDEEAQVRVLEIRDPWRLAVDVR